MAVFDTNSSGQASLYYSTYFGGNDQGTIFANNGGGTGVAVDAYGKAYITGFTYGTGFPTTSGAFQSTYYGAYHCHHTPPIHPTDNCETPYVAKFDPSAKTGPESLIYSTLLGGSNQAIPYGIAVDAMGNVYVVGQQNSWGNGPTPFPTTPGAFQTAFPWNSGTAFVAKLSPGGSQLVYSTLLGGTSDAYYSYADGIGIDAQGNAYVTGRTGSRSFPLTPNAFRSQNTGGGNATDAFLTKFNSTGSALIYSSYLGGYGDDGGSGVAVDAVGDAYVAGTTSALDFPVTAGAFQPLPSGSRPACEYNENCDGFITKFPTGAPGGLTVAGIAPGTGGNVGTVTGRVVGSGFHAGADVELICNGESIPGIPVVVDPGGRTLTATFNLRELTPTTCDLTVTNPDATVASASSVFTVVMGGAPAFGLDIIGRGVFRGGQAQTYFVEVANTGNIDASTRLWVGFPYFIQWYSSDLVPSSSGQVNGIEYVAFDVSVTSGGTATVPISLTVPDLPQYGHITFLVQAWDEPR